MKSKNILYLEVLELSLNFASQRAKSGFEEYPKLLNQYADNLKKLIGVKL